MQRWRGLEDIPEDWGRSVVTIGSYDGVHRGHQLIIRHAVDRARELGVPSVVVTFDPHPSEVVRPGSHPPLLAPHHRRAELMAELGVDAVLVLPFTTEFSKLSPADFVVKVLVDKLHARAVVEGPNFRFGHKAAGTVDFLREQGRTYDFEVEVVDLYVSGTAGGGEPFSSTLTRRLVAEGDVEGAREILGRPHRVEGVVVRGAQRGRELGFPTANVETLPHTAVPADGVYAGWLHAQGEVDARRHLRRHQPAVRRHRAHRRGVRHRPGRTRPVRTARRRRLPRLRPGPGPLRLRRRPAGGDRGRREAIARPDRGVRGRVAPTERQARGRSSRRGPPARGERAPAAPCAPRHTAPPAEARAAVTRPVAATGHRGRDNTGRTQHF